MSLLGLDVGTTGCKAVVFDEEGRILGQGYREYPLIYPQPGWIELDSNVVWEGLVAATREAVSGVEDPVQALSVACQGEACTAVAADGSVLDRAIVTFDSRTVSLIEEAEALLGRDRVFRTSGQPLHPMGTLLKVLWVKRNRPDIYQRTWKFLCYGDFVLHQLGVPPVIDYSMAARTMAFDLASGQWSNDLLSAVSVDSSMFAEPQPSGTVVGTVSPEVAEVLGLPAGVKVVTGGHDQPCGAFGAGVVESGVGLYATGTVECVTTALAEFGVGLGAQGYPCYPHVVPGLFVTLAFNFTGGALLRWYRDTFGYEERQQAEQSGRDVYDLILADLPPGPSDVYVLPHFTMTGTPWLDPAGRGAIVGLNLATTKKEIVRAILEGTTYEMALNLEYLSRAGVEVEELRAVGGGARSSVWLQLKADLTGKRVVRTDVTEAVCLGAAMLAGVGVGVYSSPAAAVAATVKLSDIYEPEPLLHARYRERLATYERIYPAIKAIGL